MRIGVITDCFKKPHADGIKMAAELGLSGVQIYATSGDFSPETLSEGAKAEYKRLLSESGLVVSAFCADMGGYGFEREEDNAISFKDDGGTLFEILGYVSRKEIPILRVERKEPSLEALFMEAVGK